MTWFLAGIALGLLIALPVVVVLNRRSVSEAREAERRARNAERLAEIGTLTGGLAHEIKNPLSTIGLNAQLLLEDIDALTIDDDEKGRLTRRMGVLRRETDRLRDILTDFLQFAGRVRIDAHRVDLNDLVEELGDFYHAQAEQAGVTLRIHPAAEPVTAPVDGTLMKQALLNLVINACQAIEQMRQDGAGHDRQAELILRIEPAGPRSEEARIHVTDTGPGIEPAALEKIFHPYFTTKSGGNGLGLATTRRIVEEHGGSITVHSEPGIGTDFTISLPIAMRDAPGTDGRVREKVTDTGG
jgi:signal transduction histidine kinase